MRPDTTTSRLTWGLLALILLLTSAIYATAYPFDYVNYDDPLYITYVANRTADGLDWGDVYHLGVDVVNANWHPVTLVSFYLDYYVHRMSPAGAHLHNGLLHVINVLLVFLLLRRLLPGQSFVQLVATGLFALHPVNVGAVAWVAERKGLLSATFALLSTLQYLRYRESGRSATLLASIGLFVLSVLSKATSVVLPVALILIDWYRYNTPLIPRNLAELFRLLRNKWAYFVIALVAGLLTIRAHSISGALASTELMSFGVRIGNFLLSLPAYFRMLLLPKDFAFYYPFVREPAAMAVVGSSIFMAAIIAAAVAIRRRFPHLLFAVLWMLVWLTPLSGIIKSGPHFLADRYMYIAALGMFVAMAQGLAVLASLGWTRLARFISFAFLGLIAVVTAIHLQFWRSPIALYTHALDVTGPNIHAETNLATFYARNGDTKSALKHFRRLITYASRAYLVYRSLGEEFTNTGRYDAAEEVVDKGLKAFPNHEGLLAIKSEILRATGRTEESMRLCKKAVKKYPNNAVFFVQLGRLYREAGQVEEAKRYFNQALAIDPEQKFARQYLAELQEPQEHQAAKNLVQQEQHSK